jgi:hypothetical protein
MTVSTADVKISSVTGSALSLKGKAPALSTRMPLSMSVRYTTKAIQAVMLRYLIGLLNCFVRPHLPCWYGYWPASFLGSSVLVIVFGSFRPVEVPNCQLLHSERLASLLVETDLAMPTTPRQPHRNACRMQDRTFPFQELPW